MKYVTACATPALVSALPRIGLPTMKATMHERPARGWSVAPPLLILTAAAIVVAAFLAGRGSMGLSRREAADITRPSAVKPSKASTSFAEARPVLDAHGSSAPAELRGRTPRELEAAWTAWVSRHDAAIHTRLERGDEDSIVNFWLYGTTFTALPRATARDLAKAGGRDRAEDLLLARLDDLVDGIAAPGANERLRFARRVVERKGIDPTTEAGKQQAKIYLVEARQRAISENARYRRLLQSATVLDERGRLGAYAEAYRDRGLSSDTSIHVDFAVEEALQAIKMKGVLSAGGIRRVAIVGPGLDFTDKIEGYDFYPQQTIQPFALIDSLLRVGLASDAVHVATFDLSPRVNQHLEAANEGARNGESYVLQLPLDRDVPGREWLAGLVNYWQRLGDRVGDAVDPIAAPEGAGGVRVRAVRVRPSIVRSIVPHDLNIVLERLEPMADDERFDLIVATNVLVYYDAFEQALALANIAHMLKPRALFLTNYAVAPVAAMEPMPALTTKVYWDRQHNGDTVLAYRKR